MIFWLEDFQGAEIGEVNLPEIASYATAPQRILWDGRVFYLQAERGGGYREHHRLRVVEDREVRLRHPSGAHR